MKLSCNWFWFSMRFTTENGVLPKYAKPGMLTAVLLPITSVCCAEIAQSCRLCVAVREKEFSPMFWFAALSSMPLMKLGLPLAVRHFLGRMSGSGCQVPVASEYHRRSIDH